MQNVHIVGLHDPINCTYYNNQSRGKSAHFGELFYYLKFVPQKYRTNSYSLV